jgi:hypothetical protein
LGLFIEDPGYDLEARQVWQSKIRYRDIEVLLAEQVEAFDCGLRNRYVVTVVAQDNVQRIGHGRLIFNNQD